MQKSHKKPLEGHLADAQITNSTEYHLSGVDDTVCPEDAAAAAAYAPTMVNPFPPGSWQANNAARFR
jgi:hypothetical protein